MGFSLGEVVPELGTGEDHRAEQRGVSDMFENRAIPGGARS